MRSKWQFCLLVLVMATAFGMTACTRTDNAGQQAGGTTPGGTTQGGTQGGTTPGGTTQGGTPAGTTQGGGTTTVNAEAVVKQNCIACHGDTLDGRGNANMNLQQVGARLSKDQIATTIANGRNNMPGFKGKLKDEEITALSDWLAAKK